MGLIDLINRLLMDILPRRLDRLLQRSRNLGLNGRHAPQSQAQSMQRSHRLHHIAMAQRQPSRQVTDDGLRARPEISPRHLLRPSRRSHLSTGRTTQPMLLVFCHFSFDRRNFADLMARRIRIIAHQ